MAAWAWPARVVLIIINITLLVRTFRAKTAGVAARAIHRYTSIYIDILIYIDVGIVARRGTTILEKQYSCSFLKKTYPAISERRVRPTAQPAA